MYSTQNNNSATIQAINEEDTEIFRLCTESSVDGRIRYHYYSDGAVYKEIRSPFEETKKYEMTLEEINSNKRVLNTRGKILNAVKVYKQTGDEDDLYRLL